MKRLITICLCLAMTVKAAAQFHTITNSSHRYRVITSSEQDVILDGLPDKQDRQKQTPPANVVTDGAKSINDKDSSIGMSLETKGKTEAAVASVGDAAKYKKEVDDLRQHLIQQYLGVAYPLRHIHVTSSFGMRHHPILHKQMMHEGIDLRARYEEVYSIMDGRVIAVESDKRSGRYIVIRYPGNLTCSYCHLSQPLVAKGDSVKAGEVIAISGNTGMSSAPHLHLGVRNNRGERLDPMLLLQFIHNRREEIVRLLQST